MSKPRIRVINRHGFLAYRVVSMGLNVFYNNIIWFEGKRYLSAGDGKVFFTPGTYPRVRPKIKLYVQQLITGKPSPYFKN